MTLPLVISPGDVGHIAQHEEVDELLSLLDGQTDFLAGGIGQGLLVDRPAAAAGNERYEYFATDVPELSYSDGASWRALLLASTANTYTAVNQYDDDVFFGSGRPWADVRHHLYGAEGDNVHVDDPAFQAANDALAPLGGGTIFAGPGQYRFDAYVDLSPSVQVHGSGRLTSLIRPSGANGAFRFSNGGTIVDTGFAFVDIGVQGVNGTSTDLISLADASGVTLQRVGLRNTASSCLKLNHCYKWRVEGGRMEDFVNYAIDAGTGAPNIGLIEGVDFNANAVAGLAFCLMGGTVWSIHGCNLEGNNKVVNGVSISGSRGNISENFMEKMTGHSIGSITASSPTLIAICDNHFSSNSTEQIDFSNATAAAGIVIHRNGFRGITGAKKCFVPGPTTDYEFLYNDADGTPGAWVFGAKGTSAIDPTNVIKRKGKFVLLDVPVLAQGATHTAGAVIDVTDGNVKFVNAVGNVTGLSGFDGQEVLLIFAAAGTTMINSATLKLHTSANFVATANDIMKLFNMGSNIWAQTAPASVN